MLNIILRLFGSRTVDVVSTSKTTITQIEIDSSSDSNWPVQVEEVFGLPPELPNDYEAICDGDAALYDDATLYCPPRWAYTIRDLDTYARVVES